MHRSSSARLPRLRFDCLEDRVNPSTLFVWDGGGVDDLWSTAANWLGDLAPTATSADPTGVIVQFAGGSTSEMDVDGLTVDRLELLGNDNTVAIQDDATLRLSASILTDNLVSEGTDNVVGGTASLVRGTLKFVDARPTIRVDTGADLIVHASLPTDLGFVRTGGGDLDLSNAYTVIFGGPVTLESGTSRVGAFGGYQVSPLIIKSGATSLGAPV